MTNTSKEVKLITKTAKPKVSVIIPLFNHEQYIEEAVNSVLGQSFEDFEIIIINDGSTDRSEEAARSIRDDRITYYSQDNQGAPATINRGVKLAGGEFISILNSDDIYDAKRLEECVKMIESDPSVSAVFSRVDCIDESGAFVKSIMRKEHVWSEHEAGTSFKEDNNIVLDLIAGNFLISTSNLFCRKCVFEKIGYFSDLKYAHDYDFFLRLCYHYKAHIIETPLVKYRVHACNTLKPDDPEVSFEVGLTLATFFLKYNIGTILPESPNHDNIYETMMKFFNSINTYRADRLIMVLLLFGMGYRGAVESFTRPLLDKGKNPFKDACIGYLRTALDGWEQWRETNDRLIEKEKELRNGWVQWHEANDRLIEKEKELRDGWTQWHETNGRLIERDKELEEGWSKWKETNDNLVETNNKLVETNDRLLLKDKELLEAYEGLASAKQQIIDKNNYILALKNSLSYRLGRVLTWPLRKLLSRN